jgi:hypothetical protein
MSTASVEKKINRARTAGKKVGRKKNFFQEVNFVGMTLS